MRKSLTFILFSIFILLFFSLQTEGGEKEIFEAMQIEIDRSMAKLRLEEMDPPYFISLRMRDVESNELLTSFGSLLNRSDEHYRHVQAIVRVGSPALDHSNFEEMDFSFFQYLQRNLPHVDDIKALRHAFWIAIDEAYKKNLKKLSKKKGYLEKHPQEDYPADFLAVSEKTIMILPKEEPDQIKTLHPYVQKISENLRKYSFLTEGIVNLKAYNILQYYLDSEGNKHIRPEKYIWLKVDFEAYTKDWYPIKRKKSWIAKKAEELPNLEKVSAKLNKFLKDMEAVLDQKPLEEYTGPVIFVGQASGKFFSNLFATGISKPREPISAGREMMFPNPLEENKGFLAKRFGRKVLPTTYEVWDKPNAKAWKGRSLIGYLPVDDEGIKSKDIHLVNLGKLKGLPMRRTATKKFTEINGHARCFTGKAPEGSITSLFVEDKEGLSSEDFMEKARALAEEEGFEEILIIVSIKEFEEPSGPEDFSFFIQPGEKSLLANPLEMYLYNAKSGEKKPVWGLEFSGVTERALTEIIASTKEQSIYQFMAHPPYGSFMPKSIIAPDILIQEMTLQKAKVERLRTPDIPMPEIGK
jgi:predicted Zn-dependent protease